MKQIFQLLIAASLLPATLSGQTTGPYTIRHSAEFESPKGHPLYKAIPYDNKGIVQVNVKGSKSFSFQLFNDNLEYVKENTILSEGLLAERSTFKSMVKLNNKTYCFFRDVYKEDKTEGISALEFDPDKLDFVGKSKNLFKSSSKIRIGGTIIDYGFGESGTFSLGYTFRVSNDRTKFLYTYDLLPAERKDELNKDIVGFYVFDENLNRLWGEEIEMPYTEAKMDNLEYLLSDDGKVYLLAKVYEGVNPKDKAKDKSNPNYNYEVLIYEKGQRIPKIIEVKLDNYFTKDLYLYEDANHKIVVAGFYTKGINSPIDGAFMVRLDVEGGTISKLNGGYYEIPSDVIKSYMSDRQKEKIEKKEKKHKDDETKELGINNLQIRDIYAMQNGSSTIIAEQYWVEVYTHYNGKTTTTTYKTFAFDIFVMNIDANGKLAWVKKVPKRQRSGDAMGKGLSLSSYAIGNDVHLFYIDHIENFDLPETEAPRTHMNNAGGFLVGVHINETGMIRKYNLGDVKQYETNFFIRDFIDGRNNNLIDVERKKKKNILFSIDIK